MTGRAGSRLPNALAIACSSSTSSALTLPCASRTTVTSARSSSSSIYLLLCAGQGHCSVYCTVEGSCAFLENAILATEGRMAEPIPGLPGPALLFCPADRPDRYAKAVNAADGVILDLEDGVGAAAKEAARQALMQTPVDPARAIVRVSAVDAADHARDIAACRQTRYRTIMLAKAESRAQLDELAGQGDWQVIALVETALGILRAEEIASAGNVVAVMWGAEDLIASMHGRTSRHPDGTYRGVALHARATTLLAA